MNRKKILLSIFIIAIIILIILDPKPNIDACLDGILLWSTAVLPTLFPFFFLTTILTELNVTLRLSKLFFPITSRVFRTSGLSGYVYATSIISGYPMGAKTTADLYQKGYISSGQAYKITTFTSTSGPLFIIGTVGSKMFGQKSLGVLILLCHILGSFLNGLLYRNCFESEKPISKIYTQSSNNVLEDAMYNSIKNILVVGGYIAIFSMLISMIDRFNIFTPISSVFSLIFGVDKLTINAVLSGLIEVTSACFKLSALSISTKKALILCTGLISFGGASIHMQAYTFLKRFNMPIGFYLKSKVTQTIISVAIAIIVSLFI